MASKPPVVQEPIGPVARPAKTGSGPGADGGYKLSDAEALKLTVRMRGNLSRREFAKLIAGLPRVARILSPFGLRGCYVDDEKTLAEFDTALANWARANGRSDLTIINGGPITFEPRQTSIGPTDPAMLRRCREDPEACMSPQQRWELYNQRVNRIKSDGIGAVLAGVGELTAAGLTAAGVPMEFNSDRFMENAAPATGLLNAIGSAGLQRQNMEDTVRAAQPPQKTPPAIIRPATPAAPSAQSSTGNAQSAKPTAVISTGALPPGMTVMNDPFGGPGGVVTSRAQTSRSLRTGIDATGGEFEAFNTAVFSRREVGLQSPGHVNVRGVDFVTAARRPDGKMEIILNDATINMSKVAKTSPPPTWVAEAQAAVGRMNLGDPALEAEIRDAMTAGRVRVRTLSVGVQPEGRVDITGW
jgi:hypothetical protein